jgi:site-specific recombinase XerC
MVKRDLSERGFRPGTLKAYRQVLFNFAARTGRQPYEVNRAVLRNYLHMLAADRPSSSWIAANLSVMRTVLDKQGGLAAAEGVRGPKRPRQLPEILAQSEVSRMLECAGTLRDQLLLGLLYGCGLKVGEVTALRWRDVDPQQGALTIAGPGAASSRRLPIPEDLKPLLAEGVRRCAPDDFIFAGARAGTHLVTRTVELIVRGVARTAGVLKPVTCMSLRHAYAVHSLEAGENIRAVQVALGHGSILTTLRYQRCILPVLSSRAPICDPPRPASAEPAPVPAPGDVRREPARSARLSPPSLPVPDAPTRSIIPVAPFGARRNPAVEFYHHLKHRLRDRFLALRARISPPRLARC